MQRSNDYLSRIIGPPGCGKTTYLSRQVRVAYEAGNDVMVCSLTRAAAVEVAGRDLPLDRHAIGTLHSHALRALGGGYSGVADGDDSKFIVSWNEDHPSLALSKGARDLDEDNASPYDGKAAGDTAYNAMNNFRARMIGQDGWPDSVRVFHSVWQRWKKDNDLIDFTDMLEIALETIPIAPGNPNVIFADESQDFSALEMALLNQWGRKAGRLVVVGDPWQALYEWRGSDPAVFFEGEIPPDNQRLLGQSYRVPQAVHHAAMQWMEQMPGYEPIEYLPTDAAGSVNHLNTTWKDPKNMLPMIEESLSEDKSVMILASCAYMLTGVISALRQAGIPFHNEYRRKNGAWNPLARKGSGITSTDRLAAFLHMGEEGFWTRQDLMTWLSGAKCSAILPSKQSYKKFEPALLNLDEGEIPYGLVEVLLGSASVEHGLLGDLEWYVDTLQATRRGGASFPCAIARRGGTASLAEAPRVSVGTIHSVKGGEADTVILCPDLSRRGVESWTGGAAGRASIYRLMYVGMTRAKESLNIMNPATPKMAVRLN